MTGLSTMAHTVRKRDSNGIDSADKGETRPPCHCWDFPFSGATAMTLLMLRAGGQAEHRTLSGSQMLERPAQRVLQCPVFTTPHRASHFGEKLGVIIQEIPYFLFKTYQTSHSVAILSFFLAVLSEELPPLLSLPPPLRDPLPSVLTFPLISPVAVSQGSFSPQPQHA